MHVVPWTCLNRSAFICELGVGVICNDGERSFQSFVIAVSELRIGVLEGRNFGLNVDRNLILFINPFTAMMSFENDQ